MPLALVRQKFFQQVGVYLLYLRRRRFNRRLVSSCNKSEVVLRLKVDRQVLDPQRDFSRQVSPGLVPEGPWVFKPSETWTQRFDTLNHPPRPSAVSKSHSPPTAEHRNPMLLLVFVGSLFRLAAKTPAFVLLFQLPPRRTAPPEPQLLGHKTAAIISKF
jgi:hypothetical protein